MNILKCILSAILLSGLVSIAMAQDKVVVNSDGTYSVIEYPVGKEVTVNLVPSATITGGKGIARVVRSADGTKVYFDVSGVPSTTTSYYAYAVDPSGMPTLLGPVTINNGVATAEFMTPMNQFMLLLSPNGKLTRVSTDDVVFTSEVPAGYTVIPRKVMTSSMTTTTVMTPAGVTYDVPLLNVPSFGKDAKTVKLHFDGTPFKGLDAKAHVHRHDKDMTTIRMEFDDLKKVPATTHFVLWAYSPDGQYTKLGHVMNNGKDDMTINAKTTLKDFGLLLTAEDSEVAVPTSKVYSVFRIS